MSDANDQQKEVFPPSEESPALNDDGESGDIERSFSNDSTERSERRPSMDTLELREHAVSFVLEPERSPDSASTRKKTERNEKVEGEQVAFEKSMEKSSEFTGSSKGTGGGTQKGQSVEDTAVLATGVPSDDLDNKKTASNEKEINEKMQPGAVSAGKEEEKVEEGSEVPEPPVATRTQTEILAMEPPRLVRGGGGNYSAPGAFPVPGPVRDLDDLSLLRDDESRNAPDRDTGDALHLVNAHLVEDDVEQQQQDTTAPVASEPPKVFEATPMGEESALHAVRQLLKHRSVRIFLVLIVFVFVGLVVGLVVGLSGGGSGSDEDDEDDFEGPSRPRPLVEPTPGPALSQSTMDDSDKLEELIGSRLKPRSIQALLNNPGSPQATAYRWLLESPNVTSYSAPRRRQRYALATFFYATSGPSAWLDSDRWLTGSHECEWFTSSNETICENDEYRSLQLIDNQLEGVLESADLYLLTSLRILDLTKNAVFGNIPTWIDGLSDLTHLVLWDNFMSGSIPLSITRLENLEVLDLQENNFVGRIPSEIGSISNLITLHLSETLISGQLPTELGLLTNMEIIAAFATSVSGTVPVELSNLQRLYGLDLDAAALTGELPTELGLLTNLIYLYLGYNFLSSTIPTEYGNMRALQELTIDSSNLSGSIPSELSQCTDLYFLYLSNNTLTGTIPTELGGLLDFFTLDLSLNELNGTIPTELGLLTDAASISLASNRLEGAVPSELGKLAAITNLELQDNNLEGTMPVEICSLTQDAFLEVQDLIVDCAEVECECCAGCAATGS